MKHLPSPVSFREDINGLRAYAVIAVLLFHFSLIGLPGGFAGVDVFFVISGFLMTAIIVSGHEKSNFSIVKFYMARARRVLPALMVLITFLIALGWFFLPSIDYQALGTQSVFALTFLSNFYYFLSAGYFDAASHEKWLLHTWSLAVEAQFYVLFPLFVAIIWRFWPGLKALTASLLILFFASLFLNILATNIMATNMKTIAAFYLLPTRGWELAAGGLVYLLARQGWVMPKIKQIGYWLGWLLMLGSFVLLHEEFTWPGCWAIFPVFGASLIILGQREKCKLINNGIVQWLGERSYSLYLWHWPLVVSLYSAGLESEWIWVSGAFTLSLLLANLSYLLVEVPTRQFLSKKKFLVEILLIGLIFIVVIAASIIIKYLDFNNRPIYQTPEVKYLSFYSEDNYLPLISEAYLAKCNFNDWKSRYSKYKIDDSCVNPGHGVLLWGDSHAQALSIGIRSYLYKYHPSVSFSQVATSGCDPKLTENLKPSAEIKKSCDRSNKFASDWIRSNVPSVVILAQVRRHDSSKLLEMANLLLDIGVSQVLIIGPVPQWQVDLPRVIVRSYWESKTKYTNDPNFERSLISVDSNMKKQVALANNGRIIYISILDGLCDEKGNCLSILDDKMTPLAFDYGHLTIEGSIFVTDMILEPYLREALNK